MILTSQPVPTDPQHPVVYAPVALTGVVLAFTIERQVNSFGTVDRQPTPPAETDLTGSRIAHLNLTPRIVAKLLTESYQRAIAKTPVTGTHQPIYLSQDPDFLALNPEFEYLTATSYAAAGADVMDQLPDSDATRALWAWVLADPWAVAFLRGVPDPWGMTVNPEYKNLITQPQQTVPKSDPTASLLPWRARRTSASPTGRRTPTTCTMPPRRRGPARREPARPGIRMRPRRSTSPTVLPFPGSVTSCRSPTRPPRRSTACRPPIC